MRTRIIVVSIAAVLLLLIAAGLVFGGGLVPARVASESNSNQPGTTVASSPSSTNYPSRAFISIVGSAGNGDDAYFAPGNFTVAVGATVIWTNQDRSVVHNVVSTGNTAFSSGDINPGTTWTFTFTKPGTYSYFCSYHPWMTGAIVVVSQAAGG